MALDHHVGLADIFQSADNSGISASFTERFNRLVRKVIEEEKINSERLEKLERKVLEQEKINSDLTHDITSVKSLQNGDRKEFCDRLAHLEPKINQMCGGFNRVRQRIKDLESQVAEVDIRSLSSQLGDLRSDVDQLLTGIQGADASPAPDLIDFTPVRSLIFEKANEVTKHRHASDSSMTIGGNLIEEHQSFTSRPPSVSSDGRPSDHDLPKQGEPKLKRVRFDLAPEPGSDDPLITDFMNSNHKARSHAPAAPGKGDLTKTTASKTLLDKFRNGDLENDSDESDEIVVAIRATSAEQKADEASLSLPVRKSNLHNRSSELSEESRSRTRASRSTQSDMDLANQAFVSVQKASVSESSHAVASDQMALPATRRSQRVTKPRDFGNVVAHRGNKRARKS